ncbi:MAG: HAMP domain-containing histidine kinase, partial [Nitrospinae bacterium]|nr:HAMP domain-containing histidine kinase [Nitrospinota bacterium]
LSDADFYKIRKENPQFTRSSIILPLIKGDGKVFGVLKLCEKLINGQQTFFDQGDLNRLTIIINLVTPTIFWFTNVNKLQNSIILKDTMLHAVIHDLKSPVFCLQKVLEEEEKVPFKIINELNYLYDRITQSLDINRIKKGKLPFEKEFILLNEFFDEIVEGLHRYIDNYNVEVDIDEIEKGEGLDGDRELLKRVFLSLIRKAIQFSSDIEGGDKKVKIKIDSGITTISFSIIDTGRTISDAFINLLKEEFKQIKNIEGNSGIGLIFCKLLIELHGGTIEAKQNKPKGSIFKITLPLMSDEDVE